MRVMLCNGEDLINRLLLCLNVCLRAIAIVMYACFMNCLYFYAHSLLDQEERESSIRAFKERRADVLVY